MNSNSFIHVKTVQSRVEADLMKNILEGHGIKVMVRGNDIAGLVPIFPWVSGIKIYVEEEHADAAEEILKGSGEAES